MFLYKNLNIIPSVLIQAMTVAADAVETPTGTVKSNPRFAKYKKIPKGEQTCREVGRQA